MSDHEEALVVFELALKNLLTVYEANRQLMVNPKLNDLQSDLEAAYEKSEQAV